MKDSLLCAPLFFYNVQYNYCQECGFSLLFLQIVISVSDFAVTLCYLV